MIAEQFHLYNVQLFLSLVSLQETNKVCSVCC